MNFQQADAIRKRILEENDPVTGAGILGQRLATDQEFYDALHGRELAPGIHIQNPGPDAAKMADKLVRRVQGAAGDYVDGMNNPKRDPVAAAVRAAGKWENRIQEAIRNKSFEKGVRAQDYPEGVRIATADGGSAFVSGVTKRQSKIQKVYQDLAPRLGAVSQAVQAMPQDTEAQREQRLLAARRMMINIGKQRKGISGGGVGVA